MRFSIFTLPPHGWLLAAAVAQIILTALLIQIPSVRHTLGIQPPNLFDLLLIAVFGLVVAGSMEAVKAVARARSKNRASP